MEDNIFAAAQKSLKNKVSDNQIQKAVKDGLWNIRSWAL